MLLLFWDVFLYFSVGEQGAMHRCLETLLFFELCFWVVCLCVRVCACVRVALCILYDVMYSRGEGTLGENIPTSGNIPGILAAKWCQSSGTFSGFLSDRRAFMMFLTGCLIYQKNTEKQQQQQQQQQQNIIEHWISYLPPTEKGYLRSHVLLVM